MTAIESFRLPVPEPVRATAAVLSDAAAIEAARDVWTRLRKGDIDADIDYFMTVVEHAVDVIRPHVIHARRDDGSDLIAVARLERLPIAFRLGYRKLAEVDLNALVMSFGGLLGTETRRDEDELIRHLTGAFDRGEADLLLFRNIDANSTLHDALSAVPWFRRAHFQGVTRRRTASIPNDLSDFLMRVSAKSRSSLRRRRRAVENDFGSRLELRTFDDPADFDKMCRDMDAVAAKTYQRALKVGFQALPMQLALIELGLRRGWYRCWMHYVDGEPISFWSGFSYSGTFYIGTPGYDPAYAKYSIGQITMLDMIAHLCADPNVNRLDFGHGEADYKTMFGDLEHSECDMMLVSARPWPMFVVLVSSLLSFGNNKARQLADRLGVGKKLKAAWRQRLAKG